MSTKYFVLMIFSSIVCCGCTSQEIYEATQPKYTEAECRKLPQTQYQECKQREAMTYEEYERKRKESDANN